MTERRIIFALAISYLLGIAGGWGYYVQVRPSEEQKFHMQADSAIRDDLCARLSADIKNFEEAPQMFKRSSLKVLISESTAVAQTQFQDGGNDQPIKFRGTNSESIVAPCQKQASRWVKIASVFPDVYEAELALIKGNIQPEAPSQISKSPSTPSASPGKRLALVIGNSTYDNRPLKNPENDAKDIGLALKGTGFRVIELYNADLKEMRNTIKYFSEQLSRYDTGLVYYSGHGIEFAGRNYFIPINADIKSEDEIPRQGFDATEIVEKMSRSNVKTSIFIIDACRNAPVFSTFKSAKSGLTVIQGSSGSVVAFSAAPGQVALDGNGRNSPYTSALLQQIHMPNKKIEDVMKDTAKVVSDNTAGRQIPWYNSSLVGDFYFSKQQ
jgi:hypothetical protein